MSMIARAKLLGCLLCLGASTLFARADVAGDYKIILERNPFGLKPPPAPPAPATNTAPVETPTAYKLSGITALFRPPRAMFVNQPPGKPTPEYLSLSEGQRQGSLEVLPGGINVKAGTVRVKISGEERTMSFEKDGLKPASGPPAMMTAPGVPTPMPVPGYNPAPATPGGTMVAPPSSVVPQFNRPPAPVSGGFAPAAMPTEIIMQSAPPQRPVRVGTTPIPLTQQNTTSPPPAPHIDPAEQALRIEIQRIVDAPRVNAGELPPLPPTDLSNPPLPAAPRR